MSDDGESLRYVQNRQRQLVREGSEEFLRGQQQWFDENKSLFAEKIEALNQHSSTDLRDIAESLRGYINDGEHDSFWSRQIFEPILDETLKICREFNFVLKNDVRFVNSPGVDVSPAVLPSEHEHTLFAGQGTYSFCNYWAKVFTTAIYQVGRKCNSEISPEKLLACLKGSGVIADAAKLAFRYAAAGSLVGYGKLPQLEELTDVRVQLVTSMEVFIVAHEVAHFISHEKYPGTQGIASDMTDKELELLCDTIGLTICMAYGEKKNNIFARQLIGPLLFFYALRICDQAAEILGFPCEQKIKDSHPSHIERIHSIFNFLEHSGVDQDVKDGARQALEIAMVIGSQLQIFWHEMRKH